MRYVNKFDYIVENVAQARAILNHNNINYDNPIYQDILKTTKRDGYTGFITKIVFDLDVDKDDAKEIYYKVKKDELDVSQLNKMSKEEVEKILDFDESNQGYKYLFTENHYKVFRVDTYEGILKISSPAWCLKTKSYWDDYTKTKEGMQFVVIQEKFVPRDEILLTTPSDWDGQRYESGSYAKMRFGVTVYPMGRMDVFDDSNIQLTYYHGNVSNYRYHFMVSIFDKILEYHKEHSPQKKVDWEEYDQMKDTISDVMYNLKLIAHFSNIAPKGTGNVDAEMNRFYDKMKHEVGLDKEALLKSMNQFKDRILSDDGFINESGYMDILVNEFLIANGAESLPDVSNITPREHPLAGYYFDEQEPGDTLIKYYYGYQYTKYGKAGIEQGFGSVEIFYETIARDFVELMLEQQYMCFDVFGYRDIKKIEGGESEFEKRLAEVITDEPYKDGRKIIIDLPKLLKIVKELHVGYSRYDYEKRESVDLTYNTTEDLAKQIKDSMGSAFKGMEIKFEGKEIEPKSVIIPICTLE